MDREEMMDFLRENISIETTTESNHKCGGEYLTIITKLQLKNE